MSYLQRLVVHFSQFLGTGAFLLLLGFITFPILTRVLSLEDYGILGLITNTIAIAVALAKGGISDSIIRFYREHATSAERLTTFTSTAVVRGVLFAGVVVAAYVAALPLVRRLAAVDARYLDCFLIMSLFLFARPLNILVMNFMRARGAILALNICNAAMKIAEIALALALLLWVVGELYGYLLGVAVVQFATLAFLYRWLLRHHRIAISQVSGTLTRDLLKFGFPLLLTELAYLLLSYADRYMIVAYHGQSLLGLYNVGYNVPSYINDLVMFSLSYAIVPIYTELYAREGRRATEEFLSRSLNYYLMAVIPLCAGYAAVSRDALVTLASAKYAAAAAFSPVVLVGMVFLGMNYILYAGLYLEKKTGQILAIMLAAVAINIVANIVLLPAYGAMGAAVATLVACVASSVLTAILGRRYMHLAVAVPTILVYAAASAVMYGVVARIETGHPWLNLVTKIPAGVAIIAAVVLVREREIRLYAWQFMRSFLRKAA